MSARTLVAVCAVLTALSSTASEPAPAVAHPNVLKEGWAVRTPAEPIVAFNGLLGTDSSPGTGGFMMYPAIGGVGGFFAAVLTHGVINSAARSAEASKAQKAADAVFEPYRGFVADFKYDALLTRALDRKATSGVARVTPAAETVNGDWAFTLEPVLSMTQDQTALILNTPITVYAPNAPAAPVYQNALQVISAPLSAEDAKTFWSVNNGDNLKAVSAELTASALGLAAADVSGAYARAAASGTQKTMRYLLGTREQVERAELLQVTCERAIFKTLRGGLMSVPLKQPHSYAPPLDAAPLACAATEKK